MDLCDNANIIDKQCPVKAGVVTVAKEIAIPNEIPPGRYVVTAEASNVEKSGDAKTITCMKGEIVFSI